MIFGGGRDKGVASADGAQSWRELAGHGRKRRIPSREARRRQRIRRLRALIVAGLGLALAVGGGYGVWWWLEAPAEGGAGTSGGGGEKEARAKGVPIRRITLRTDGVLPERWVASVLDLKPGLGLMDVDIHELKARMEEAGQVKSASVERVFPDELNVRIEERTPLLRLRTENADGERRERIVARDGTVYEGIGYPEAALRNLPYLVPYRNPDGDYFPLSGIGRVAELLELAREEMPDLYRGWRVVSLEDYSGDPDLPWQIIEIRSRLVPRILFSASGDFGRQLDRLDYILEEVRKRGNPEMEQIDLSLRGAAAVQFSSDRVQNF